MPVCPSCQASVEGQPRFCPTCGASLSTCPACGAPASWTARFCESCGHALGSGATPEEERKVVTILFADVTGSTSLGEQLDPERLRTLLRSYFGAMAAVAVSWGGTLEKFIGDAIVAAFGVPAVREDDAERALHAALQMLATLEELNVQFERRYALSLRMRIGVNTGEVIAPVDTPPEQLIVTGDAVNVAARLQEAAEPGTILVGERTYLATRGAFRFDAPTLLNLKGKSKPVSARKLAGPGPEPTRGIPELWSPMVGRERELDALFKLFEEASRTETPRIAVLYGPAGMGKSRLVQEFVDQVTVGVPGRPVLRGRCLSAGRGVTYWALGSMLRFAYGIGLAEPAEFAHEKLWAGLRRTLAPLGLAEDELDQTVFALAATAGISLPESPLDRMQPREVAEELSRAWPRFATAYAARGPAVFVVEDLHLAGDELLDMVERVVARSAGPLVVVATARPELSESHPGFAVGWEGGVSLSLRPLTDQESATVMDELLAHAEVPTGLRAEVLSKAEGNPFFLEEIIRRLIDEEALVRTSEGWRATKAAKGFALPDSVHSLIAARIDSLPPVEKRVLQEAAVIGRVFWEEPVARSMGDGPASSALLALERKGLILARSVSSIGGQSEFRFRHSLVREVAYSGLPRARRARAHAEVGAWIEHLAGSRVEEFAELIAHHFSIAAQGEDADLAWGDDSEAHQRVRARAFESLVLAGNIARRRFALEQALQLHELALPLARNEKERARILEELGDDHEAAYHGDEALQAYMHALGQIPADRALATHRSRLCIKAVKLAAQVGPFRVRPDPRVIEELLDEGLAAASDEKSRGWLLALTGTSASVWIGRGVDPVPLEERIRATQEALAIATALEDPELHVYAAGTLDNLLWMAGRYHLAVETARRRLDFLDSLDSVKEKAEVLATVAYTILYVDGAYEEARDLAERSAALAKTLSAHEQMHATFVLMGAAHYQGRWEDVPTILEEHLSNYAKEADVRCAMVQSGPSLGALSLAHRGETGRAKEIAATLPFDEDAPGLTEGLQARLAVALGDIEGGRRIAERVLAAASPWRQSEAALALIEALVALQDHKALTAFLPRARAVAASMALLQPACDRAEGMMKAIEGDTEGGIALLRDSLGAFDRFGVPFEAARTREALAELAPPDASELLVVAASTYKRLGALPHLKRVSSGHMAGS